jgi:hypothetical protein
MSGEKRALCQHLDRDSAAGIREARRVRYDRRVGIDAQWTRSAGRAVERRLEVAGQVVMLELGRNQEDGVHDQGERREASPPASSLTVTHYFDDTPRRKLRQSAVVRLVSSVQL